MRRRGAYQENNHARGEDSEDDQPPQYRWAQGSFQKEGHRLSRIRVCLEQSPLSPIESAERTQDAAHSQDHLPTAQGASLPPCSEHCASRYQALKPPRWQGLQAQDLWLRLLEAVQTREGRGRYWLCCDQMVPPTWVTGGRWLWQRNRHVGSCLYYVRINRWKSSLSRRKLTRSAVSYSKVVGCASSWPPLEIPEESEILGHEVSIDPKFR